MMHSFNMMSNSNSCCGYSAVATSCARIAVLLDTALCAVSILFVSLLGILILGI